MYSEEDINSAVREGAITSDAAARLRAHVSALRQMPRGDEESFRLLNSFNDIFVSIGVVILLLAAGAIGQQIGNGLAPLPAIPQGDPGGAFWGRYMAASTLRTGVTMMLGSSLVAATSWILAEFFTRRRRMALPSILLLLSFVGAVFAAVIGAGNLLGVMRGDTAEAIAISSAGLLAAAAAWLHWRRFMVPITVAAGAAGIAITLIALAAAVIEGAGRRLEGNGILPLVEIAGLMIFALAMWWDMSDRERTTRRSDVAFWLHLLAAPMIAHPLFYSLGVMNDDSSVGIGAAVGVIAIYMLFGLVALAIDRRALLVSALAYVLAALTFLFDRFGAVELNFALTALVIGSALLTLSAFWTPIRARVVAWLPARWQARLPMAGPVPA